MSNELFKALFKLQGEIRGVKRDSKNPHFKNTYASLEGVTDTIRPHMQNCGLIWLQYPGLIVDGSIEVTTEIIHAESGQSKVFTMQMPLGKRDPQGAGSALTYAQRYSLMAALGLPPTDDDAEVAIDREEARPQPEAEHKSNMPLTTSAAQKKRDLDALENELLDCSSMVTWKSLVEKWRLKMDKERWPEDFRTAARSKFAKRKIELSYVDEGTDDTVADIQNEFPGARIVAEQSTLMAG